MQDEFRHRDAGGNLMPATPSGKRDANWPVEAAATIGDKVNDAAQTIRDAAASKIDELKTKVVEATDQLKTSTSSMAGQAADRIRDVAQSQKNAGADALGGAARLAAGVADDFEQGAPKFSRSLRNAAQGVEQVSKDIHEQTVAELIGSVGNLARERPIAALLSALLTGIVVGRIFSN